jgi:hypothetical protein
VVFTGFVLDGANAPAELDFLGVFLAAYAPGVAVVQPVIRLFHLIAVFDMLLKNTEMVAYTATVSRIPQSGKRIQETRRKPPKAAVTQPRVLLGLLSQVHIDAQLVQGFLHRMGKGKVKDCIAHKPPHQEFHRQVIHGFYVHFFKLLVGGYPVFRNNFFNREGQRVIYLLGGRVGDGFAVRGAQHFHNTGFDIFLGKTVCNWNNGRHG